MTKFVLYPLQQLRNKEFPDVVEYSLDIVEKHNPVELKIEGFYNLALEKRPLLDVFSSKIGYGVYKPVIDDARLQRKGVILAIILQAKAAEKAGLEMLADARSKVIPWVNNHLYDLTSQNLKVINREVGDFLREYDENTELASAATALGIKVYVDTLKTLQQNLETNNAARIAENAMRRSANRKEIKTEVIFALGNLFRAIDLARVEHTAIDYTPLINELSEMLAAYQSLVKGRSTRAKTSADNKTTTAELSTKTSPAAI